MKNVIGTCCLLFCMSVCFAQTTGIFEQLGLDIDGEAASDFSGVDVSLDGNRVAIGALLNSGNGTSSGHVRVYEWNGTVWTQLGLDIDGEAADDQSGRSVSLDGDRVAIGAARNNGNGTRSGHVRVYEWNGTAWLQLGLDIDGEAANDQSGWSVSLDRDRVAIGAPFNGENSSGHTRVYEWNGTAWTQLGLDIDGEYDGDASGLGVSLDGDRLAIGAQLNNGTGENSGHVRVYEWNDTAWTQLGADIDGTAPGDQSGASVSLDRDRVAIGARFNNESGIESGHARVFEWNGTTWIQLGLDIGGEAAGDQSGWSVSLCGDRVAIGSRFNDGNGEDSGHVRVYAWNGTAWTQLGFDIDGEAADDQSGFSVSLDKDRVAIGAPMNNGNGTNSGHVRVYEFIARYTKFFFVRGCVHVCTLLPFLLSCVIIFFF